MCVLRDCRNTCVAQLVRLDTDARSCTVPIDAETLAYISAPGDSHPDLLLQQQLTALVETKAQLDARSDSFSVRAPRVRMGRVKHNAQAFTHIYVAPAHHACLTVRVHALHACVCMRYMRACAVQELAQALMQGGLVPEPSVPEPAGAAASAPPTA